MKYLLLLIISFINITCKDNPAEVKPENRRPVISSVTVIPKTIGPNDSVLVTCYATDPDGDTLVYDWITDGGSRIKGANIYVDWELWHTFENSCTVFPKNINNVLIDTLWVQCFARDRKGKSDNRLTYFILIKELNKDDRLNQIYKIS